MAFEERLGASLYGSDNDKSLMDKLLGGKEVERVKELIKKEDLTSSDLRELLYSLTSTELKLANLDERSRYILGKYFTWVRDIVKLAEFFYDYADDIMKSELTKAEQDDLLKQIHNIKRKVLHNVKFAIDIYLYLLRSSMSLEALAFDNLGKNRFEYEYGQGGIPLMPMQQNRPNQPWR